ncbi:ATP-binding protein [Kitasatospora sp. NPDC094015]|uniref:ATP-binding protein n=1 Tax=Kitasatospora sp. NPDC094015 TaxID=3155205 RepID=UPI0033338668
MENPPTAPAPEHPPRAQVRRLRLFETRGSVGRCRDFALAALHDWRWLPAEDEEGRAVAGDVLLLVTELVTNACLHAGGPRELALALEGGSIRVEVSDASPVEPAIRTGQSPAVPSGHGLRVVDRLATAWGYARHEGGKTVWLEVARRPG